MELDDVPANDKFKITADTRRHANDFELMLADVCSEFIGNISGLASEKPDEAASLIANILIGTAWRYAASGQMVNGFDPDPKKFILCAEYWSTREQEFPNAH